MKHYADSSFLISCYLADRNTAAAKTWLSRAGVPLLSLLGLASMIEIIGGTLVFLGLFTRTVAFVLSGEMAVAYFMSHAPRGFWPHLWAQPVALCAGCLRSEGTID